MREERWAAAVWPVFDTAVRGATKAPVGAVKDVERQGRIAAKKRTFIFVVRGGQVVSFDSAQLVEEVEIL
jgi:hypothetical protein